VEAGVTRDLPEVIAYCDGACSPTPGGGGWGAVLISPSHGNHRQELSGAERDTTNNRMELMGAISILRALKRPCRVKLHTDSQYVARAFSAKWIVKWQANGWRTADKKAVKNEDLWRELVALAGMHEVEWIWVRGHAGDVENSRCDELAVAARLSLGDTI
jgi:ribonuclease HI